jgi:hypothetical protein
MNLLSDVITYIRRIIKSPSNAVITDNLIIDYINRFFIMDVQARLQLFDFKKKYQFMTVPGIDQYNMPLYSVQTEPGGQNISYYPAYQGFLGPAYINGIQVGFETQQNIFFNVYPNIVQQLFGLAVGNGTNGPYTLNIPILANFTPFNPPLQYILRGHVDISGIIALGQVPPVDPPIQTTASIVTSIPQVPFTSCFPAIYFNATDSNGNNVNVADSGQFLNTNTNQGFLMNVGSPATGNTPLAAGYAAGLNQINYFTGNCSIQFDVSIPAGVNINVNCIYFQTGLPRAILFYNNTLILRSPPDTQYLVELDAYLSPAAFLSSSAALQFGYMAEYIARGAARKILSDTGDVEQFMFYEPFFKEQELLVWKRSQRQFTATRTETLYSQGYGYGLHNYNNQPGGI